MRYGENQVKYVHIERGAHITDDNLRLRKMEMMLNNAWRYSWILCSAPLTLVE